MIAPLICQYLEKLEVNIVHYFPNILIDEYDWLRNNFIGTMQKELNLSFEEEEQLFHIKNDRNFALQFKEMPLDTFWIEIKE